MAHTIDNALELIRDLLALAREVGGAALATETDLGGFAGLFIARAAQSTFSAGLLAQHGLNGDAMSVGRTVTEMAIDFAYVAIDPEPRIKKFSDYDKVSKFKLATAINDLHDGTVPIDVMQTLEARHDAAQDDNPDAKFNWAGKSIRRRALDGGHLRMYELVYADMCEASHSCYGTLEYAVVGLNEDLEIQFGQMPPSVKPADLAFASMTVLLRHVIVACGLDHAFGDRLVAINQRLAAQLETE